MCIIMGNNALLNQMIDNGKPDFRRHLRNLVEQLTTGGLNTTCYDIRSLAHGRQEFRDYYSFEEFVKLVNNTSFRSKTNFKLVVYPTFSRSPKGNPTISTSIKAAHIFSLEQNYAQTKYTEYVKPLIRNSLIEPLEEQTGLAYKSIRAMNKALVKGFKQIYGVVCYVGGNHFVCYYKCEATNVWMYYNGISRDVITTLTKRRLSVLTHFETVLASSYENSVISHLMVK